MMSQTSFQSINWNIIVHLQRLLFAIMGDSACDLWGNINVSSLSGLCQHFVTEDKYSTIISIQMASKLNETIQ